MVEVKWIVTPQNSFLLPNYFQNRVISDCGRSQDGRGLVWPQCPALVGVLTQHCIVIVQNPTKNIYHPTSQYPTKPYLTMPWFWPPVPKYTRADNTATTQQTKVFCPTHPPYCPDFVSRPNIAKFVTRIDLAWILDRGRKFCPRKLGLLCSLINGFPI